MRKLLVAGVLWTALGCSRSPSTQNAVDASKSPPTLTVTRSRPPSTPVSATMRFCAFGLREGTRPASSPDVVLATMVVDFDNPGAPVPGVVALTGALLEARSEPLASSRRLDHVVEFSPAKPSPTQGVFAVHLNPAGAPFKGELASGHTTVRVRFELDHGPGAYPTRCRVEFDGLGPTPLVVEGGVDGSWPS